MNQNIIIFILLNFFLISLTALLSLNKIDFFWKQFLFWVIGFLLFFSYRFINYRLIFEKFYFYLILFLSIIILILVLFVPGNIKSWFSLGSFSIQPSEFSKIGFFLVMATFLSYYQLDLINPFYLIFSIFLISPFIILIILQPDFGMAFLYFLTWLFSIIFFLSRKEIIIGIIILFFIFCIFWFFVLKDYQKNRILVFINPEIDPLKSGYNSRQVKLSLGTSSFFGKGIGFGEIGREGFLPSVHTDFILTFIIEERGLLIFWLYSFLIYLLLAEILKAQRFHTDHVVKNFLLVIFCYFFSKYIITSLVNFGLFPIVGLPVPFLSYGGSYLVFDLWLLAIALNLSK